jgi:hypothetical protein
MWTNLALAVALTSALGQSEQLAISRVRATYGLLGAERKDNKILPGEKYFIAFDIDGLKTDADNKVKLTMKMDVVDKTGKVVYTDNPHDQEATLSLGGTKMEASTFLTTGLDQAAGVYTVKVAIADKATKAVKSFAHKFEVLPKEFGIVQVQATIDSTALHPCPLSGVAGQYMHINFALVGFSRQNGGDRQPDVKVEMQIFDENNKATLKREVTGGVNAGVSPEVRGLPMQLNLALNRAGKFTIELKATDQVANKVSKKIILPLTVYEQKSSSTE